MSPPLVLFLALFSLLSRVHAACYYPDGSISPNDTPCQDRTAESVCCGQGYACLSNGMCQATGKELQKGGATELVRGACTDRSWRSSSCPLFCINPETDNVAGGIGIAKCQGTTEELYYCINSVQDGVNCTAKQNVLFFQGNAITTIGVAATPTPTASSTSGSTATSQLSQNPSGAPNPSSVPLSMSNPSSSSEPSPSNGSSASSNRTVTIGAAVGASVGGLALGVLGAWLFVFFRRRRRRAENENESMVTHPPVQYYAPEPPTDHYISPAPQNNQIHEAPNAWKPPLVQDHYGPQELPGWQPEPRRG
ncbi:hypothetical protein CI238_09089 [Colletotrichum incanum]|uniref:Uncharacterized protein n=1 Tax=Colletotrichum incanum TaxID=1573173 RepID=A0A161VEI5_COLIC|nr:hypothetical protein CI238_09089 [Colletotrichum incanum]